MSAVDLKVITIGYREGVLEIHVNKKELNLRTKQFHRAAAKSIAEYLLSNAMITVMPAERSPCADEIIMRAYFKPAVKEFQSMYLIPGEEK